jgi:hypothetical protein
MWFGGLVREEGRPKRKTGEYGKKYMEMKIEKCST